jgi:GT2 family glycosyltransferase
MPIKNMNSISISIVIYKTNIESLRKTLYSIKNSSIFCNVLVIDNFGDDVARDLITDLGYDYLKNPFGNTGFGAGHNLAISKSARFCYHLVLNPDVEFESNALEELSIYMENNPSIALISPKIVSFDGSLQYLCKRSPTLLSLFARRFLPNVLKPIFQKVINHSEMRESGYNSIVDAPYLSGCFMFIRRNCLDVVGLFDENFFLHFEDADLSIRLSKKFRTTFFPSVVVKHGWTRDSHRSLKGTLITLKSAYYFFSKHGWKIW